MAKFSVDVAVAFAPQVAEGTYNATLDGITSSLSYTQGLVLGNPEAGIKQSGLSLSLGRRRLDRAFTAGFTRSLSDWLLTEVPTFTFSMPFVGNRNLATATPVDADARPLLGLEALLNGANLVGGAWGSGVGWRFIFGSAFPFSSLVYLSGNRLELRDCRCSLDISFPPGSIPMVTATIVVGDVKDISLAALPGTLTYGPQASVTAPKVVGVNTTWLNARGFSEGSLIIAPAYEEFGDSNAATGFVQEQSDRETRFEGVLFADDTVDEGFEISQLGITDEGDMEPFSFQVGANMVDDTTVAEAVQVVMSQPELVEAEASPIGSKMGYAVTMIARGASGGGGNDELELIFR